MTQMLALSECWQKDLHICPTKIIFSSSQRRCFVLKGVLRNFEKVTGKHLCQSLFYNKVAGWGLQLYQKRDSATGVFSWILQVSKNTFFTEYLRMTASAYFQSKQEESQKLHSPPTKEKILKRKSITFDRFLISGIY